MRVDSIALRVAYRRHWPKPLTSTSEYAGRGACLYNQSMADARKEYGRHDITREGVILNALVILWRGLNCHADARELWDRRRRDGNVDALRWAKEYCPRGVELARAYVWRLLPDLARRLEV